MKIVWFARGGNISKCGPFPTQVDAVNAMRLVQKDSDVFPPNVFVFPEEVEEEVVISDPPNYDYRYIIRCGECCPNCGRRKFVQFVNDIDEALPVQARDVLHSTIDNWRMAMEGRFPLECRNCGVIVS